VTLDHGTKINIKIVSQTTQTQKTPTNVGVF